MDVKTLRAEAFQFSVFVLHFAVAGSEVRIDDGSGKGMRELLLSTFYLAQILII